MTEQVKIEHMCYAWAVTTCSTVHREDDPEIVAVFLRRPTVADLKALVPNALMWANECEGGGEHGPSAKFDYRDPATLTRRRDGFDWDGLPENRIDAERVEVTR